MGQASCAIGTTFMATSTGYGYASGSLGRLHSVRVYCKASSDGHCATSECQERHLESFERRDDTLHHTSLILNETAFLLRRFLAAKRLQGGVAEKHPDHARGNR